AFAGFSQILWKTLWKSIAFTVLSHEIQNVLAVCTTAGQRSSPDSERPKPPDYTVGARRLGLMRRTRTALFSAIVAATFWSLAPVATQSVLAQDHDHAQADQHEAD